MKLKLMSDKELADKLKKIQEDYPTDQEVRHIEEDSFLTRLLLDLGYTELVKQYHTTCKWYA